MARSGREKASTRIGRGLERGVDAVTLALFLLLLLLGAYALFDAYKVEKSAEVDARIAALAPDDDDDEGTARKLAELREINSEVVAWLRIDGTNINYPVVQAGDNAKYLTRDYRGEYATAGGIFVDYRNDEFNDDFTIVYGHRMSGGKMFSDVLNFADAEYFRAHGNGKLFTTKGNYRLVVRAHAVLAVNTTKIYVHELNRNGQNAAVLTEVLSSAGQARESSELTGAEGAPAKLLLLSTCDKDSRHYRDVLLVEMVKED